MIYPTVYVFLFSSFFFLPCHSTLSISSNQEYLIQIIVRPFFLPPLFLFFSFVGLTIDHLFVCGMIVGLGVYWKCMLLYCLKRFKVNPEAVALITIGIYLYNLEG